MYAVEKTFETYLSLLIIVSILATTGYSLYSRFAQPPSSINFQAGFESGSIEGEGFAGGWRIGGGGTVVDAGQSITVVKTSSHHGLYSLKMTVNGAIPIVYGYRLFADGQVGSSQEVYHDFSLWSLTKNPTQILTVENTNAYEGNYAFKMMLDSNEPDLNSFASVVFSSPHNIVYAQTYVKITQQSTDGVYSIFGLESPLGVNNIICLDKDRRLVKSWRDNNGYHETVSATTLNLNQYYCLKIMVKVGRGDGESRVWLDGQEILDLQNLNLVNTNSPVTSVFIGQTGTYSFTGTATVYFDSVSVGTNFETVPSRHNCLAYKMFTPVNVVYARTYIKVTEISTNGRVGIFGLWTWGNALNTLGLDSNRQLWQSWADNAQGWRQTKSSTVLSLNEWHSLEVMYKVGDGDGEARVWLDGNEVTDLQHLNLVNTNCQVTELEVGCDEANTFTSGTATVYYDCIVVASSYIGPENRISLVNDQSDTAGLQTWQNTIIKEILNSQDYTSKSGVSDLTVYCRAKTYAEGLS